MSSSVRLDKIRFFPNRIHPTGPEMVKSTILVIEDDLKNMKLIKAVLKRGNYAVLEATTAEDEIEMARNYHPDIILMDIKLPGINRIEPLIII